MGIYTWAVQRPPIVLRLRTQSRKIPSMQIKSIIISTQFPSPYTSITSTTYVKPPSLLPHKTKRPLSHPNTLEWGISVKHYQIKKMGCASSKRIDSAIVHDVYRPAPTSFAVFDINAIEEPWVIVDDTPQENQEKPTTTHIVPVPILDKLNALESDAPHTWDEVSKVLEVFKPSLENNNSNNKKIPNSVKPDEPVKQMDEVSSIVPKKQTQTIGNKSLSFRTIEELDVKLSPKPPAQLRKTESLNKNTTHKGNKSELGGGQAEPMRSESGGYKPVKENIFIVRDRLEREKEGKEAINNKRLINPLSEYPEKCPPGGADKVVLYTTSLSGVRRTYEDCNRVRSLLEGHQVVLDERDVALHGGFLKELKELLGEGASVPRMFMKGRYIGGAEEVVELNERGQLVRMLRWGGVERGVGRLGCEGCGGARFVPCIDCGGSCKVLVHGVKERCDNCNENGLVHCPACASL